LDINEYLGKRLRRRRRAVGMTQHELAEHMGVTFQQVQKYECAASQMPARRLPVIAAALGVSVDYFFAGLDEDRPYVPTRRPAAPAHEIPPP